MKFLLFWIKKNKRKRDFRNVQIYLFYFIENLSIKLRKKIWEITIHVFDFNVKWIERKKKQIWQNFYYK
jgi:hypothetical protein